MRDRTKAAVAGCRQDGVRAEWFFPDDRMHRQSYDAMAKRICRACPLRWECHNWAVTNAEPWGTWGATTEQERRCLLNQCNHVQCRNRRDAP